MTLEDWGERGLSGLGSDLWVCRSGPTPGHSAVMTAAESTANYLNLSLDLVSFSCCLSLSLLSKDRRPSESLPYSYTGP